MAVSELMTEDREALRDAISKALPDETFAPLKKKAMDLATQITDAIEFNLKDDLASNLAYHVREMAGRVVESLLNGNESEMIRWLSCDTRGYTGRRDGYNVGNRERHSVIHGKLFETGCIALRKSIAQAHADLIQNQRILDLEDQVQSLVSTINKLEAEKAALIERMREYR